MGDPYGFELLIERVRAAEEAQEDKEYAALEATEAAIEEAVRLGDEDGDCFFDIFFAKEARAALTSLVPRRRDRRIIAREAVSLFALLSQATDAAAGFEALAKVARYSRRGRPRGTRLDPKLLADFDNRPEGQSLYAFAKLRARDGSEADKIRKRLTALLDDRERRQQQERFLPR